MKKFAILFLLFLITLFVNAQIIEQGEHNPTWGVRATFDVNMPGHVRISTFDDKMFRTGTGGAVGAVCNIYLGHKFYLEPAVSLFYDTYSYNNFIAEESGYQESDPTVYKVGLRVPIVAGYSIPVSDRLSIAPFTGPELSYAFAGDVRLNKDKLGLEGNLLFGNFGFQRRIDCGWKIGAAFFSGMWSFNIDATIGMTNLMTNGTTFRENRCSVNVTRYF